MSNKTNLDASAKRIGHAWKESAYYADAEKWTNIIFWNPDTVFRKMFDQLDLTLIFIRRISTFAGAVWVIIGTCLSSRTMVMS
jgi:hypothetical protein